jgi:hypothetical protein
MTQCVEEENDLLTLQSGVVAWKPAPSVMDGGVAPGTKRNQVLLGIVTCLAAKFLVMNLKM